MTILGVVMICLMKLFPIVDWWVDDGMIFLELLFAFTGVALCTVLIPAVRWLERQSSSTNVRQFVHGMITTVILLPYFLIGGILLFYRE